MTVHLLHFSFSPIHFLPIISSTHSLYLLRSLLPSNRCLFISCEYFINRESSRATTVRYHTVESLVVVFPTPLQQLGVRPY